MQKTSNKIKATAIFAIIIAACFVLSSCSKIIPLTPLPLKAVIFSKSKENSVLYNDLKAELIKNKNYDLQVQDFNAQNLSDNIKAAVESGVLALVVQASLQEECEAALTSAKLYNIPVIFTGIRPTNELMQSYDKAWFLGTDEKNAGEQLGSVIAQKFKDGQIADVNGDGILQMAVLNSDGQLASDSAVLRCADLGVFSQNETKFEPLLSEGEGYSALLDALNAGTVIEAILTEPDFNAKAAVGANIGLEKNIPVFAIGDETQLKEIGKEGKICAIAAYPDKQIASAIHSFLINIFKGEDVTNNTDISLSQYKTAMFAYELMQL